MKYNCTFYAAIAVLFTTAVSAQDQEKSRTYSVINTFDSSFSATGDFDMEHNDSNLGELSVETAGFSAAVKMRNDENTTHAFSLQYSGLFFDIENKNALPLPDQLNSFELNYQSSYFLNEEWGLFGSVSGVWNGSGTSFDSDGFGVGLWMGAIYMVNEDTTLFFGAAYNSLGDHHFMPGAGVEWKIDNQWTISVGFPETAITYNASETLRYSLLFEGNFGAYYVEAEDIDSSFNLGDSELEYEDYRMAFKADWDINENVSISAKLGCILSSEADYYNRSYKIESDEGAIYGELGLRTRF